MIDKIEFTAKNLTSNSGVLLLLNYTEEQRIFQKLDEMLVFDNKNTEATKMNHSVDSLGILLFLKEKK